MTKAEELSAQLQAMIHKTMRSLAVARQLIETNDYDFASSRAYYAAFYAMQAALLTKGLSASKHADVICLFSQHFIKPGIFPTEFSKFVSWLFSNRQSDDYGFDLSITKTDTQQDIKMAEKVVQAIIDYLTSEGFLPDDSK